MWLKYIILNLNQINDLDWVQYLLQIIGKIENQFNPGQFRGALFHLNFQAYEKQRYLKQIKRRQQAGIPALKNAELIGRNYASTWNQRTSAFGGGQEPEQSNRNELLSDLQSEVQLDHGLLLQSNNAVENLFETQSKAIQLDELKMIISQDSQLPEVPEIETIEKMSPDVKMIFLKIREQLQDTQHPLVRICAQFQQQFVKQVDRQGEVFIDQQNQNFKS